ncbi:hypothetical protein HOB76_05670 [Candidatus Woesearchaeota archaeon]|jgi:hypothetical protein|nr:hypothetical protein [Candidatus Woesearchaeota archaeon]
MKRDFNERTMTTKQQVVQMNHYWKDLNHAASDDVKKKNMDMRFGIKNIKLDRTGNIISFDKYKRGAYEDHNCNEIHPEQSHKEWEKEQKESMDWKKFDTPYGDRHGKKFDTWNAWEKIEKEREKLEKSQNDKKQMNNILMPRSPKNKNKTHEQFVKETRGSIGDMEHITEDMEEINVLIEEIDMLCKDSTIPILREDQVCEFLLLKDAVGGGKIEELRIQAEASKVPSKGLSPAQRRKMAIRMRLQAKKPGFIMKRLRSMKRAATKATIAVRARKAAIKLVVKKFFPKLRTKKTSELSYSERGKISQIVKKKSKVIDRFAKKLLITTRKKDIERRKAMAGKKDKKGVKGES